MHGHSAGHTGGYGPLREPESPKLPTKAMILESASCHAYRLFLCVSSAVFVGIVIGISSASSSDSRFALRSCVLDQLFKGIEIKAHTAANSCICVLSDR
jgi:hypothetical protein